MLVELLIAIIGSSVLTALVTELFRRGKTRSESRKADAEADNVAVDTASDLVAQIKRICDERVAGLESKIARLSVELETERTHNRSEVVSLMQDLGKLRQSLQMQSNKIAELLAERNERAAQISALTLEVSLWKGRVIELLIAVRDGKPIPDWAREFHT